MRLPWRMLIVSVLALGLLAAVPRRAAAHPMGNFTINRYSALTVATGRVDILYVVDMAEIPTYQELTTIRADHSTNLTPGERDAYTAARAAEVQQNLALTLDGRALPLALAGTPALSFPPGAGGLPTLRLELNFRAPLAASKGSLAYEDSNYADRIGWKEIVARPAPGIALLNSTVPTTDESNALHVYRPDLINNPPQVTAASLLFLPGTANPASGAPPAAVAQQAMASASNWAQGRSDALTDLINRQDLSFWELLIGLAVALGFGAAHALGPGHGKTIVGAYLVGTRGTAWHAVFLGLTVTITHTIGVFLLGAVVLYAEQYILPEQLYPWLGFLSGLLIVGMGLALFVQRRRLWRRSGAGLGMLPAVGQVAFSRVVRFARPAWAAAAPPLPAYAHKGFPFGARAAPEADPAPRAALAAGFVDERAPGPAAGHSHTHDAAHPHSHDSAHEHSHTHDQAPSHDHSHEPGHASGPDHLHQHGPFGPAHSHLPADGQSVSLRSMLLLGITGGIIPCPSALVVLLAAVAYHRVGLGLLLILMFSVGLAGVLTGIGLLMVSGRSLLGRLQINRGGALFGPLPMLSALLLSGAGLLIAVQALAAGGVFR